MKKKENYHPTARPLLIFQFSAFVTGCVLLLITNGRIKFVSFICAVISPIIFLASFVSGIKAMINARRGWNQYRSKSAQWHYRIAGFLAFAPIAVFFLFVIISVTIIPCFLVLARSNGS